MSQFIRINNNNYIRASEVQALLDGRDHSVQVLFKCRKSPVELGVPAHWLVEQIENLEDENALRHSGE